ncbi:MAG: glycan-binding surface protein [Bacteroidota bacterium]|nr:glycan-binding surface protein [Bacteroidota bacterium]
MKKILIYHIHLLLLCVVAGIIILPSCLKEKPNAPSISYVRNYAASPNDTILKTVSAGQWVVVVGKNLSGISQAYFGSTPATINSTFFSDTCIVIQIPSIQFPLVPRDKVNKITLVNEGGVANFEINITGVPIISYVKNSADSPNDSIIKSVVPNQLITIVGYNLKNATNIAFQGVAADLTNAAYTDSSVTVRVPADLSGGDASLVNMISITTMFGTGDFSIKIIGPPIITSISYEIPKEGDSVYIYGNNFISVMNLSFAGTPITSYKVVSDAVIGFTAPALSGDGGPVVIETKSGTFTTAYLVNNINFINGGGVGIIANMEWGNYFGYAWWGGGILNSSDPNSGWPSYNADFGVGTGMYIELKSNILNGGAGDDGNAIRISDAVWLPAENFNDPGNSWALKFEINVAKPWNGGTICIKSSNGSYMARYEPWQVTSTHTAAYSTKGWQTVTIPLSEFRLADGKGASITKVSDLFDPASGKGNLILYLHNYSTAATGTSFDAAFDNFRVVKR